MIQPMNSRSTGNVVAEEVAALSSEFKYSSEDICAAVDILSKDIGSTQQAFHVLAALCRAAREVNFPLPATDIASFAVALLREIDTETINQPSPSTLPL